jgi:ribosomal protein S12
MSVSHQKTMIESSTIDPRHPKSSLRVPQSLQLWKIVSKETTFGGGEHHTNGTRVDEEDSVPANALARELRRTEHRR